MNVIWDNAPAHRGEALREYLRTPCLGLRLVNPRLHADRGMYFILRLTQLIVRPDSRLGVLRYKSPPNAYYRAHSVIPA